MLDHMVGLRRAQGAVAVERQIAQSASLKLAQRYAPAVFLGGVANVRGQIDQAALENEAHRFHSTTGLGVQRPSRRRGGKGSDPSPTAGISPIDISAGLPDTSVGRSGEDLTSVGKGTRKREGAQRAMRWPGQCKNGRCFAMRGGRGLKFTR